MNDITQHEASSATAPAALVNRTHRVIRERARNIQAQKREVRSLWIPLCISAGLLALFCFAVWSVFDQNQEAPTGLPDASQQMLVFLMWCLPVSAAVLAVVWFRRANARTDNMPDNGSSR